MNNIDEQAGLATSKEEVKEVSDKVHETMLRLKDGRLKESDLDYVYPDEVEFNDRQNEMEKY